MSSSIEASVGLSLANTFKSLVSMTQNPTTATELNLIADKVEKNPFQALDAFNLNSMAHKAACMGNYILGLTKMVPPQLKQAFDLSFELNQPQSDNNDPPTVSLRLGGTFMLGEMCKGIAAIIREAAESVRQTQS